MTEVTDLQVEESAGEDLDTKERLVRAAIEVFLEKGYGGTRVQDIARRAGFTSGALYVHFSSRTALLAEAIVREGNAILGQMINSLNEVDVTSAGVASDVLAALSADEPTTLDRLLLEALALAARDAEAKATLASSFAAFEDMIDKQIRVAKSDGLIDPSLSVAALRTVITSLIYGSIVAKALKQETVELDELKVVHARMFGAWTPQEA
jgi:AcrR family transcriptional regulator